MPAQNLFSRSVEDRTQVTTFRCTAEEHEFLQTKVAELNCDGIGDLVRLVLYHTDFNSIQGLQSSRGPRTRQRR